MNWERTLVIVAHSDDETLGAGGLIARQVERRRQQVSGVAGPQIHVSWLTYGCSGRWLAELDPVNVINIKPVKVDRDRERRDAPQAMLALGLDAIQYGHLGMYHNVMLDCVPQLALARKVEGVVQMFKPTTVVTHWPGDLNVDHQCVFRAVMVAARPQTSTDVNYVQNVVCMEIPSSTAWSHEAFKPNLYVPMEHWALEKKCKALRQYETEQVPDGHQRSDSRVRALAQLRGSECGHPYAEAFHVIRQIG